MHSGSIDDLARSLAFQTGISDDQWMYAALAKLSPADMAANERCPGQFHAFFEAYSNMVVGYLRSYGIPPSQNNLNYIWFSPVLLPERLLPSLLKYVKRTTLQPFL